MREEGKIRKLLKGIIIGLAALLVLGLIVVELYWNNMLEMMGDPEDTVPTLSQEEIEALIGPTEDTVPTETTVPEETWPVVKSDKEITNIMLVGQNFREDEQNKLSDTMILCSINRKTKTMTMVSFLRDLYVPLPAYAGHGPGRNRINVCYALGSTWKRNSLGGMEMLALCIEQNFGIHVDHTIEIGFEAFTGIIDALGGVDVEVTEAEAKYMTEEVGYVDEIQPGYQTLYGDEALAYARIRKIDSDRQRAVRQRTVISSLIEKCRDMSLKDIHRTAEYCLPFIVTDMTNQEITNYVLELAPLLKEIKLYSLTCPADNETLPHSMWAKTIDLYGYQSYVIECNTALNGRYLRYALGISDPEK